MQYLFRPTISGKVLKDLKDIDLSLRTVATQLLNITHDESSKTQNRSQTATTKPYVNKNDKLMKIDANPLTTVSLKVETRTESTLPDTTALIYGRPINSKFSYFGSSHPGEAMALTEEEIEKELNFTKTATTQKTEYTTNGGISTWILLNPPSTSMKNLYENTSTPQDTKEPKPSTTGKPIIVKDVNVTSGINKVLDAIPTVKPPSLETKNSSGTQQKAANSTVKKATVSSSNPKPPKSESADKKGSKVEVTSKAEPSSTTAHSSEAKELVTTLKPVSTTKKTSSTVKQNPTTTSKVISTTGGLSNKSSGQPANRPKNSSKRVTPKPNTNKTEQQYTSKIEKVTLKPVLLTSTDKVLIESNDKPFFVAKLKGTITTAFKKHNNSSNSNTSKVSENTPKPKLPPQISKLNNDSATTLQEKKQEEVSIRPVTVNTPALSTEQIQSEVSTKDPSDVQFTRVPVLSSSPSSSTKRPRNNSKRKKNKQRRRKPSRTSTTSTTTTTTTSTTVDPLSLDFNDDTTVAQIGNAILEELQESKIEPETKVAPPNSTKNKPGNKNNPISTQIYNFLSREVMPSFGVMSLVGLGLGIASYFLYPFGGAITRRNYAVEPNYKYNLDEYGGSNGQNEEDVLRQVFQGMTSHDSNTNNNNYNNYYHYNSYGESSAESTKKNNARFPESKPKVPVDSATKINYRNLDYKYQDPSRPAKVEEKPKVASPITVSATGNRQFVVGSVLKDFVSTDIPNEEVASNVTEKNPARYEDTNAFYDYGMQRVNNKIPSVYDVVDTASTKPEDDYDKLEITSTVVAVEHGPRALKVRRSVPVDHQTGGKKGSVIQVIPPKEPEKEDDLNNEILDIIDSVIPHGNEHEGSKKGEGEKVKVHEKLGNKHETATKASASHKVEFTTLNGISNATDANKNKDHHKTTTPVKAIKKSGEEKTTHPDTHPTTHTPTKNVETTTIQWVHSYNITHKTPTPEPQDKFNIFHFMRNVAEVKFRLGLTLLKHASEGFTRYISHVQKRLNGDT